MVIFNSARRQRQDQVQSISVLNSCIIFCLFWFGGCDSNFYLSYIVILEDWKFFASGSKYSILFAKLSHSPICSIGKRSWAEVSFIISVRPPTHPPGEVRNYETNFTNRFTSCNTYKFFKILLKSYSFLQFQTIS